MSATTKCLEYKSRQVNIVLHSPYTVTICHVCLELNVSLKNFCTVFLHGVKLIFEVFHKQFQCDTIAFHTIFEV